MLGSEGFGCDIGAVRVVAVTCEAVRIVALGCVAVRDYFYT